MKEVLLSQYPSQNCVHKVASGTKTCTAQGHVVRVQIGFALDYSLALAGIILSTCKEVYFQACRKGGCREEEEIARDYEHDFPTRR